MSEERFYNQMREQLFDYSPEVPQSVYSGMRRKLWWAGFTSFKAFRFNMWYLLMMVGGASALTVYGTKDNTESIATKAGTFESRSWETTLANATAGGESATTSCCASHEQTGTCGSVKNQKTKTSGRTVNTLRRVEEELLTSNSGTTGADAQGNNGHETPETLTEIQVLPAQEIPVELNNPEPESTKVVSAPTKSLTVPMYYDKEHKKNKK
jgi:hypothetical protein